MFDDGFEHMPTVERLKELLVGKSIVRAEMRDDCPQKYNPGPSGHLTLSDGTELIVWGNEGGCACSAGCYPLTALNGTENAIMNVEIEERPDGDDVRCETCGKSWCAHEKDDGYYRIFVLAFGVDERINLASFEGSDGNGYYGTGWWLSVAKEPANA